MIASILFHPLCEIRLLFVYYFLFSLLQEPSYAKLVPALSLNILADIDPNTSVFLFYKPLENLK